MLAKTVPRLSPQFFFLKAWSIDLLIYTSLSRLRAHFHVRPTITITEILGILTLILYS